MKVISKNIEIDMPITWAGLALNHPIILLAIFALASSSGFLANTFSEGFVISLQVGGLGLIWFCAMRYYQPSIKIRNNLLISDYLRFPALVVPIEFEDVVELRICPGAFGLPYLALATKGGFRFTFGHGQSLPTLQHWLRQIQAHGALGECSIPKPWLASVLGFVAAALIALGFAWIGAIRFSLVGVVFIVLGISLRWVLLVVLATKTSRQNSGS